MVWYRYGLRPLLFALSHRDPEIAHNNVMRLLKVAHGALSLSDEATSKITVTDPRLEQNILGLHFPNPVGLAAGFDKNMEALRGVQALGFGFIEGGTITKYPQNGNPRPRMFRLPADKALINRMGFNNNGAFKTGTNLARTTLPTVPLGINIGKSKKTPVENMKAVIDDYLFTLSLLFPFASYIVINVSSPNTPDLRQLQNKPELKELLMAIYTDVVSRSQREKSPRKPIFVKVAPDLTLGQLDDVLEVCQFIGIDGIITTNTTIQRSGLVTDINESGGLSGPPVFFKARHFVRHVRDQLPNMPIIAVGGISKPADAIEMFRAGANLIQLYTGLIYQGPTIVHDICAGILNYMRNNGMTDVSQIQLVRRREAI